MASQIYESKTVHLLDGTELYLTPLKIKYLRDFMVEFETIKLSKNDIEAMDGIARCSLICMRQYNPLIKTIDELEDVVDMNTMYEILEVAAGISFKRNTDENIKEQAEDNDASWESLDLAKLESELFLLGIWKDYEEMETSLSMPELIATLNAKRDIDYNDKKFAAAMQGVDLDKQSGKEDEWEKMKARVFSKGKTGNPNDIIAYQGANAQKAGFGINMGLDYEDLTK
jgi:hypothetical protein